MFKNNNKLHLMILLLTGTVLFAQGPDWAKTGVHKKYPSSKYLLGVGISGDKTTAAELARADVAKQIQVKIESELESVEQELTEGNKSTLRSEISSRTKSVVSETVAGIEIKETKKSKGNYYVLAVLNKDNYLTGLNQEMNDISAAVLKYLSDARDLIERGNLFSALDSYSSAQDEIPGLYIKRSLYTALTGKTIDQKNLPSPAGIQSEIRRLFSSIHIEITGGNNQRGLIGAILNEPVDAFVYITNDNGERFGLRQFPVTVKYANGEKLGVNKTDDAGQLSVSVIVSPGNSILLTPDFHNVPDRYRDYLPKIQAAAKYSVRTSNLSFAIDITDITGRPDPSLVKRISRLVHESGYKTDQSSSLKITGAVSIADERSIKSPAGKQFLVEIELSLTLTNTVTGIQLSSVTGGGKGMAVGSREKAVARASENIMFSTSKFAAFLQAANQQ